MKTLDTLLFGTQYYRAPTPRPESWAEDLGHVREAGFNVVRFWPSWRQNNPKEGVYDFSDIDRLMDLAEENGLHVILNPILDVAPAWFFIKYPEAIMQTNGRGPIYPSTSACRQMGGAPGPCFHHEAGIRERKAFLTALIKRYCRHPALYCWDMWSEPEHTCCLRREPNFDNLTCYCGKSEAAFKAWLGKRYHKVEALNAKWGRTYQSFSEVELPRSGEAFNDMIDWRLFMSETITEEARMRMETLRSIDSEHLAMMHTVTLPFFPLATCGSDDVALSRLCDITGNSVGSEPLSAAISVSAAEGKQVINAEIHAVGGSTYTRPKINTPEDIKRHIFVPMGLGIKGFIFWQFRPERLGLESPAWGLTTTDGKDTPWLKAASRIHERLKVHADTILRSNPPESEIAIVADKRSQLFDFCVDPASQRYVRSIQGAYACFRSLGYAPRIVTDAQMDRESLRAYRVIYDPFPYYKDRDTCDALRAWVREGGTLIAEACFADYSGDDGLHTLRSPGFGFEDVFGARQRFCTSAAHFSNAYDEGWANAAHEAAVPIRWGDEVYSGELMVQSFDPIDAAVLARYPDGSAAVTMNQFGRGKAIWIGTLPMLSYWHNHRENARLIENLLKAASAPRPTLDAGRPDVCATCCAGDAGAFIVIDNASSEDGVKLADATGVLKGKRLVSVMTGETYGANETFPVRAGSAEAYWVTA